LARESGVRTLSLSVADGNRARRLYERAGFKPVELDDGGSWTMRLTLDSARDATTPDPRLRIREATAPDPRLRIRDARAGDVHAIISLMAEMAAFFGERTTATPESVLEMLGDETCGALVAELDDEIVGVIAWYFYRSLFNAKRCAVIEDISVTAARRDGGIGRALLREALARIRPMDVAQTLVAAAFHNERARHLYRSLGFVDDDLLMLLNAKEGAPEIVAEVEP
jgi:ribosomal protein S18 acetylase RimI-like enzyme